MSKFDEIEKHYTENRSKYLGLLRGGNRGLTQWDAEDVLQETICYHLTHPKKFYPKYVPNKLFQMRTNHYLAKQRDATAIAVFTEQQDLDQWESPDRYTEEEREVLAGELASVSSKNSRASIDAYIKDETQVSGSGRVAIHAFKKRLEVKYNDSLGDGHGE